MDFENKATNIHERSKRSKNFLENVNDMMNEEYDVYLFRELTIFFLLAVISVKMEG